MRQAKVFYKNKEAGLLTQNDDASFVFLYIESWLIDNQKPSISLTLPKQKEAFYSEYLFAFFYNMLPEGTNKEMVCKHHKIDTNDYFGLLLTIAQNDMIGAISLIKID